MARFMIDGTVVDTDNRQASWEEGTRWDGHNHISKATGSQWNHETLYKSAKGRYYIVSSSDWEGSTPSAAWISDTGAAAWLLANEYGLPKDLQSAAETVSE